MGFLIAAGIALWFFLGHPAKSVANLFWPTAAAPWEKVDAFYYPNRSDLTQHCEVLGLAAFRIAGRLLEKWRLISTTSGCLVATMSVEWANCLLRTV